MFESLRGSILMELLQDSSIKVGAIWVPFASVTKSLLKYSAPLVLHNEGQEPYIISRRGSSLKVAGPKGYFLYCTDHQLEGYDYNSVGLVREDNGNVVTSQGCRFSTRDSTGGATTDLLMFDFTGPVETGSLDENNWLDTSRFSDMDGEVLSLVAIGFPHLDRQIDYENLSIPLAPRAIWGTTGSRTQSGYETLKIAPDLDYEPDGMSGSPVYALINWKGEIHAALAGLVTNGGKSNLYFLPISDLNWYLSDFEV